MIKDIIKNKVFKNAGWLIIGKVIQMIINFIVGVLTARYLGPSNYGLINYASAYTAFFSSVCTLGINSVIVKEFIDNPKEEGKIVGTAIGLRALSSLLSAIAIVCISLVIDKDEPITILVVALSSVSVLFSIFETFNYWFQSKLKSKFTAIASLIAYSITAIYKTILLITGKSVVYFALATSVDYICIAIILFIFYIKEKGGKLSFSKEYGKSLLKKSYNYILPGLMVAIYGQTDKIMLKHMINDAEIGYYSTAVAICSMWCFVLSAIIDSLAPVIMEKYTTDKKRFIQLNKILYCIVFYLSVVVSVIFCIFGGFAIKLLYGDEYLPTINPLRVITWYTAFSYLGVARNIWIVCENKQKYLKYIYISAALSNVLLNLIFIPLLGATGAAIASLIAQIVTTLIAPFFMKGMKENSIMILNAIIFRGLKNKSH